jgi:hypothetical protein
MNHQPVAVIPMLPADEIRTAADAGDWTRAADLVAVHDQRVRAAFVEPADDVARAQWTHLLAEQRALMLELQQQRDHASAALRRLEHDRRSAHLYLRQAALGEPSE